MDIVSTEKIDPFLKMQGITAGDDDFGFLPNGLAQAALDKPIALVMQIQRVGALDRMSERADQFDILAKIFINPAGYTGVRKRCGGDLDNIGVFGLDLEMRFIVIAPAVKVEIEIKQFFDFMGQACVASVLEISV